MGERFVQRLEAEISEAALQEQHYAALTHDGQHYPFYVKYTHWKARREALTFALEQFKKLSRGLSELR